MHLHLRRIPATFVAAVAVFSAGAQSADADPFGTQQPLGALVGNVVAAERPAIAAGTGRSLATWRQHASGLIGGSLPAGWHIGARFVDGAGAPIGEPFAVSPPQCCGRPSRPDVTYNATRDEFLVVWRASLEGASVFAQRVGSDGTLKGDRVTVADAENDVTEVARVAWASDVDEYLVVWDQDPYYGTGSGRCCGFDEEVLAMRLAGEDAAPLEEPLFLSPGVTGEDFPDVAYDAQAGRWLVAFEGRIEPEQEELRATEAGDDVLVTTVTPGEDVAGPTAITADGPGIDRPAVAANTTDGGFAVAWSEQGSVLTRESFDGDIVARLVNADGTTAGDQVEVSSPTDAPFSASPSIAYDGSANEFLIAWWEQASQSGSDAAVGRRFDAALAPLGEPKVISVVDDAGVERRAPITAARQPVVTYDRSSCTYVAAYEIADGRTNVASRGFDAPDCKVPQEPKATLSSRDSTVRGAETGSGRAALFTEGSGRCTSRRVFLLRLVSRPGRRYRSTIVSVNGKVVDTLTGKRRRVLVDLEGLPAGTHTVRLAATLADGRTLRYDRRYRTCSRKLKPSNRLRRKEAV